jgi:hypothetical protein
VMSHQPTPANEIADLKVAIREAHEILKDLKQMIKVAVQIRDEVLAAAGVMVNDAIEEAVGIGLAAYNQAITTAMEEATEAVYERFDTLFENLMAVDKASVKKGDPSIYDMLEAIRLVKATRKVGDNRSVVLDKVTLDDPPIGYPGPLPRSRPGSKP